LKYRRQAATLSLFLNNEGDEMGSFILAVVIFAGLAMLLASAGGSTPKSSYKKNTPVYRNGERVDPVINKTDSELEKIAEPKYNRKAMAKNRQPLDRAKMRAYARNPKSYRDGELVNPVTGKTTSEVCSEPLTSQNDRIYRAKKALYKKNSPKAIARRERKIDNVGYRADIVTTCLADMF
jgi:hypothetical protein